MPRISLPDESVRSYDNPLTVADVAKDIGAGLAKAAIAGKINGQIVDTNTLLVEDCELAIVTAREEAGLEVIRHSTAHLLAQAVKQLFPEAQVTIGPVIENGFYYDFSYPPGFSEDNFEAIEKRMMELAKADYTVERSIMERDQAMAFFERQGEIFKSEIIADIPKNESVSLYRQNDFIDLCRGTSCAKHWSSASLQTDEGRRCVLAR